MMTKQTEALKMAIEWMQKYHQMHIIEMGIGERWIDLSMAIQACKEALEHPAQEPVAWVKDNLICPENNYETTRTEEHPKDLGWTPLYTNPAPQPAQGEIVVTKNEAGQIMLVSRQDSEGNILSVIAESENT